MDWLEWDDVHRLIAEIPEYRLKMATSWLFFSGCRIGEAINARQSDVRWVNDPGLYQWTIPDTKTHMPRNVWLPDSLGAYIEQSKAVNHPRSDWPILWDSDGRGFARVENPAAAITAKTINGALDRAAQRAQILINVTAHVARHTYATNWINDHGTDEHSMEKLSRQVGTSVAVLRKTYVHVRYSGDDWEHLRTFGSRPTPGIVGRSADD